MTQYLKEIYSLLEGLDDEITLFYFSMYANDEDDEDDEYPAVCDDGSKKRSELLIRIRFDSKKVPEILRRLIRIEAGDNHAIVTDVVGLMMYMSDSERKDIVKDIASINM